MDSWKAWAVFFISVCVMVVVLANLDYEEAAIMAIAIPFGLGVFCALLGFFKRGREIRHQERMAMIEKGIYIEAKKQDSGVPSLFVVLLVGIGLATVIASDVEFFGFVLLFVGIGLIVRARLQHNRNNGQEVLSPAQPASPPAQPASPPAAVEPQAAEEQPTTQKPQAAEEPQASEKNKR
ncbi:MAG: hypothetical protein OXU48_10015 [candidate division Zixibacteria bacterium]|nr:hypothetical protein [candidate division Zixibacteria bacterium]